MTKVVSTDRFLDFGVRGKFGKALEYGEKIYGQGHYGEEEPKMDTGVGTPINRFGIYQKRFEEGKTIWVREKFYIPSNPQTVPQQNWRTIFANGMAAWGNLTNEQKETYNERAQKYHLHGVNLFLKEWLNSNK